MYLYSIKKKEASDITQDKKTVNTFRTYLKKVLKVQI